MGLSPKKVYQLECQKLESSVVMGQKLLFGFFGAAFAQQNSFPLVSLKHVELEYCAKDLRLHVIWCRFRGST